jgi:CubicO group peptidase (beta-lactamase class C family)
MMAAMTGGFSTVRLGRVRDVLAGYVERGSIPGAVSLVSRRGEVHVETVGAVAFDGAPMRRDTVFQIASMAKPIATVAVLILAEECRLRLDDPVERHLPELANRQVLTRLDAPLDDTVPARRPFTIRDVLTFTWGFGQFIGSAEDYPILAAMTPVTAFGRAPQLGPDEWLAALGKLPLIAQPGERWLYNTGSDLLAVLVGRVAGQRFDDFVRERILEPLGLRDTGHHLPAARLDRLAAHYQSDLENGGLKPGPAQDWSVPPPFPSGAGSMLSTADDYLTFATMLLRNGSHRNDRILSRSAVQLMTTDHLTAAQRESGRAFLDGNGWGFGVQVVTERTDIATIPGVYGWDGGWGTSWRSHAGEDLVTIVLTQRSMDSPIAAELFHDFHTAAYQALD